MAIQTNTPAAFRVDFTSQNYLTSEDLIQIHAKAEKQIDEQVFGRYGKEQLGVMPVVEKFGTTEATNSMEFGHYEQDFTREIIRVTDSYTPGGASATFTVASTTPDYVRGYPTSADGTWYTNYTTAYTQTVRENDVIVADGVQLWVTSATYGATAGTQTFVAECMQTGETVPDDLENVEIYIQSRARPEGSTGPTGRETRLIPYTNFIQIIDEAYVVSGTAMGQKGFVRGFGTGSNKWYAQGIFNTKTNFDALCEMTLLTGKKITSTTSTFNQTVTTEGMIPFVQNYGHTSSYTLDSYSLQNIDNMIGNLKKYYGSNEYMLLCSHNYSVEFDDMARLLTGPDHGVSYNQTLLDLGFDGINRSKVKVYTKTLQGFSDPKTYGSADSEFLNCALWIPVGNVTSFDEGKQQVSKAALTLKYLDVDGESNGYKEWVTGGAGAASTDNTDKMTITMRKRIGAHLRGANTWGFESGSAAE